MEESAGEGGLPVLKHKHGDATNFPPAAACILRASVQRKRRQTYFREQQQAESSSHGHVCASIAGFFGLNLFSRQFVFGLNLCSRPFFV